jgi:hypothetical protein
MTFSCPHFDIDDGGCKKLKTECIPTRKGCVLRGKVKVGEDIERRLEALEKSTAGRRGKRRSSKKLTEARGKRRGARG